jgi:hypothetical protein
LIKIPNNMKPKWRQNRIKNATNYGGKKQNSDVG